jgi:predicted exporter
MKRIHALFGVIFLFLAVFLIHKFRSPYSLETNLLALLPPSGENQSINALNLSIVRRGTKTLSFLLRSPNPEITITAGETLMSALKESGMVATILSPLPPEQQASFKDLYLPLRYQILSEKDRTLLKDNKAIDAWMARLRTALYGPGSLFLMPLVNIDPFLFSLEFGKHIFSSMGAPAVDDNDFLASAELSIDPFIEDHQDRFMAWWGHTRRRLELLDPSLEIFMSGVLPIAQTQRITAQKELFWMGTVSTILLAVLLLVFFKKLSLIAFLFLPLFFGISFGLFSTFLVFGKVHVITLTFGTTLIGCAIDYPIHYFIHSVQSRKKLSTADLVRTIGPGLLLGLGTTVLGYSLLSVTPLPGLRQIAVFTSFGLIAVFVAVVVWLPQFRITLPEPGTHRFLSRVFEFLHMKRTPGEAFKFSTLFLPVVLVVGLGGVGIAKVTFNDDIRQFNTTSATSMAQQKAIQNISSEGGDRFIILSAPTEESLLQRQESLVERLDPLRKAGGFGSLISLAPFLPSAAHQRQDGDTVRHLLLTNKRTVEKSLQNLGIPASVARQLFIDLQRPVQPLTPDEWLKHPASNLLRPLWMGLTNGLYVSATIVRELKNQTELEKLISGVEGAAFFDPIGTYSQLIHRYRVSTVRMMSLAFILVMALLVTRYGLRGGVLTGLPPLIGILVTASLFGWMRQPLSLFHVFSFVLILSIGIDYSVFFMEAGRLDELVRPTLDSVFLSTLTTLMSFGFLGFSHFPPLADFGQTTAVGLLISALCSPLPLLFNKSGAAHG